MSDDTTWSHRLATALYTGRWWTLSGAVLLTIGAAIPAAQVDVDTAVQHWFTEDDPALETYHEFQATYGNDEIVLVGLQRSNGMLTPAGFSLLRTATERLRSVDGVAAVRSLTTQTRTQTTLTGPQLVSLVPPGSLSAEQAQSLRERILRDSTYTRLVSEDGTMAAVVARMEPNAAIDGRRGPVLDSIRQKLAPLDASIHLAGTGVILNALNEATTGDAIFLVLASSLLIFLLLWGCVRRLGPVLVTLGVVGVATTWLMGAYGLAGKSINMVTLVMPTLVLVVCTADCVHLLLHATHLPDSLSPRARTVQTLSDLATPCLVTTLTTAAGFASLMTSSMSIVRDLGLFSALGVLFGLVAAFVGCAAALPDNRALPNRPSHSWLQQVINGTVKLGVQRWRPVLAGTAVVVLVAGVGVGSLTIDTHPMGYFFPDHRVRQDSERIEESLGAYAPLEFLVRPSGEQGRSPETATDSSALEPALLRTVGDWQERAVASEEVEWHQSPVDDLRRLHAALPGGTATVPASRNRVHGLVRLGRDELPTLADLSRHPDQLRVTFGLPIQSAKGIQQAIDTVLALASLSEHASVQPAGYLPLYVRMMTLLSESLVHSFGLALLVILGMIGLLFRSLRTALLSILPNGLPVLLALGLMGWLAIPLDVATMTIAAIVFGLVVDDTVHLLHGATTASSASSPAAGLRASARHTGRRMAVTTSVLAGGFLVLCFAQITSIVWFGLLSAVALGTALAVDLLVLPALVTGWQRAVEDP